MTTGHGTDTGSGAAATDGVAPPPRISSDAENDHTREDVIIDLRDPAPATRPARSRRRTVLSGVVSIGLVVAIFWYFLPQFTSISAVWASIKSMTALQVGLLAALGLWNLATYWFVMVSTMPGLTFRQAAVVTESSTAVANTVPGGGAIGIAMSYAMHDSWGFSRSRASVSLLVSGLWNNFAKLAMPVLALALLALTGKPSGARVVAGLIGVGGLVGALAVFALIFRSDESARALGVKAGQVASVIRRTFKRGPVTGWDRALAKFRSRTILLLRARWHFITLATLVSHVSLYLVLLVSLRNVGVSESDASWVEVLAVFSFARLLSAIPLTPGGVGVIEFALIGGLSAAGGAHAQVAAAVLIFRAITYVLPIPVGLLTYVFWKRNRSWRRAPNAAPRTNLVPETS
jgi:uncharacterized protein (TIRG00374 family)